MYVKFFKKFQKVNFLKITKSKKQPEIGHIKHKI